MTADELTDRLRRETPCRTVAVFDTLPSTNDHACALARGGCEVPGVVAALSQTAGRGRGRHTWAAPAGAVTLTVLVPSTRPPTRPRWPRGAGCG